MTLRIVNLAGMTVKITRSSLLTHLMLGLVLGGGMAFILELSLVAAFVGIILAPLAHAVPMLSHHYGHWRAAKLVGHPMRHVVLWGPLGTDVYPKDEQGVTPQEHIRRALGGPLANLLLGLLSLPLVLLAYFSLGAAAWPLYFFALDNLLVFTLGAFMPLHMLGIETDGSTLLKYWGARSG